MELNGIITTNTPLNAVVTGGIPGFSPIATVEQTQSGATITITDKNGTTTANILNGTSTDAQVATAVDAWLDDNVAQETGYVLDSTLTMSNAAAPADKVGELKSALDELTAVTTEDEYTSVEEIASVTGQKAYINTVNNKIAQTPVSNMAYKVYHLSDGEKYRIFGFGYDRNEHYLAVTATVDISSTGEAQYGGLEEIACGTSEYPDGYTYHTVEYTAEQDCYLYINYRPEESPARLTVAQLIPKTSPVVSAVVDKVNSNGLYKQGDNYYHFHKDGDSFIIRKFCHYGANNLFQWQALYEGDVSELGISVIETIGEYYTDVIGPISIWNGTLWPGVYGMWSGGNHNVTVGGVACRTAQEESFSCLVDGTPVTTDGLYFGEVVFRTTNKLYFPQSITDNAFTGATLAIKENREYKLRDNMHVTVRLQFVEACRVSTYYGAQVITLGFDNLFLANNSVMYALEDVTSQTYLQLAERKAYFTSSDGLHMDVRLTDIGLGDYARNDGSTGYFYIPAQQSSKKAYYMLINDSHQSEIAAGVNVAFEADYNIYH